MDASGRLGEFEALVLTAVVRAGEQANGVAVFEHLQVMAGNDVSLAAVHVTLRRLEEKGLLASRVGTPSERGGRPRRFYLPTQAGVQSLTAFRELWRRAFRGLSCRKGNHDERGHQATAVVTVGPDTRGTSAGPS